MASFHHHITDIFPDSQPHSAFSEVLPAYRLEIPIWLFDTHTHAEYEETVALTIAIFEDIFRENPSQLNVLITHGDTASDTDTLRHFQSFQTGNFLSETVFDDVFEKNILQIFMQTSLAELSYMELLESFIQRDYYTDYKYINSSTFFICPQKAISFHYADYAVVLGAQEFAPLLPLFRTYSGYMDITQQKAFLDQNQPSE